MIKQKAEKKNNKTSAPVDFESLKTHINIVG